MKKLPKSAGFALMTSVFACAVVSTDVVFAQDGVGKPLEEIVVVGTRRQDRTAVDTAVPIDVFSEEDLESIATLELLEALQKLVPSLTLRRWPFGDGASFIRPPQLRGLDSDKTLVLVNGKRRHRGALVQLSDFGSHGPDLAAIPSIALRNVEVLRDGASAMYGSDAIAGVLNFNLKDSAEGGELQVQYGQYTLGDENAWRVSGNVGLPLGDKGFINVSIDVNEAEQTSRGIEYDRTIGQSGLTPAESALVSGFFDHDGDPATPDQQRFGPDALTEVYVAGQLVSLFVASDGIPDDIDTRFADNLRFAELSDSELVQVWGRPDRDAVHALVNAGYDISSSLSLYGWANYSSSNTDRNSGYRRPGTNALYPVRLPGGEIYDPRDMYPAGFAPRFFGNVIDQGLTGGVDGEWSNGMTFDLGGRYGRSEIRYKSKNTRNPSLGPASPTQFRPGNLISEEVGLTADFTKSISLAFADDSFLAFGLEFRDERYSSEAGDPASFEVGPYNIEDPWDFETSVIEAAAGANGGIVECRIPGLESIGAPCPDQDPIHNSLLAGSEGFPGYGPLSVFDYDRNSWSVYADLEMDVSEQFLLTVAGRYEDFSDFGDNFSWRIASRYSFGDRFAVRGSVGTGFRAPTPGQIATINVQGRPGQLTNEPFLQGIFPAEHPASEAFGAVPLEAETSTQWTLGFTSNPVDALSITLDYYHIEVDDRFILSSRFAVGPTERVVLVASGVPGASSISFVSFFNNDIDTESDGIDLVATYVVDWSGGITDLSVSANWGRTKVTRRTPRPDGFFLDDVDLFRLENGSPRPRAVIDVRHTWANDVSLLVRGNWYGSYKDINSRDPSETQNFDPLVQVDTALTWSTKDGRYIIMVGGNNIFDQQPHHPDFGLCCGFVYSPRSVMDWQGPYYYARGTLRWN